MACYTTPMDTREAGRRGGLATKKRHGKKHFINAGRKGGLAPTKKEISDHIKKVGVDVGEGIKA